MLINKMIIVFLVLCYICEQSLIMHGVKLSLKKLYILKEGVRNDTTAN